MYDFVDAVKNLHAAAKASGWKFPMGTASLMHLLKIDNPDAENNQALWDIYIAMEAENKAASLLFITAVCHKQFMNMPHHTCKETDKRTQPPQKR